MLLTKSLIWLSIVIYWGL